MDAHQFRDLPQIETMDEPRYPVWATEYTNYMQPCKEHAVRFHIEEESYLDDFDNGIVSMQPMQRFLYEQSPLTPGMLYAKIPFPDGRYEKQYEQHWPPADCFRNASPDRTSSGNTSQNTQDELRSPYMCHSIPYGSPMDYSHLPVSYPAAEYLQGGAFACESHAEERNISLRELEYEPPVPEAVAEDVEDVVMKQEATPDHHHSEVKEEATPDYTRYADSGIGHSVRDAQSVEPVDFPEEPASDSDYSPTRPKRRRSTTSSGSSGRTSKRRKPIRRDSHAPSPTESVRSEKKSRRSSKTQKAITGSSIQAEDRRAFPCPLAGYGCTSNFSSKNEWKRHVSTQHIKLGYWRCDLCTPSIDSNDPQTLYHNDFNRKDLFTQHLRRMHAAPKDKSCRTQKDYPVCEENLSEHQVRCNLQLRNAPQHSSCLFCERSFHGITSWEERMEHVGRHFEKDYKSRVDMLDPATWHRDQRLERYLLDEGLVAREGTGWKIGDGKPRRSAETDSEVDSEED
ncbi:uncharacterized protein J4E88_004110 [Alternaria novae-zelandiae]|uniref:uncharacterized protein n=1 Tax=Alternaria novae-zelandiae TaxID=430562 RepID=UPI0020C25990|nr:uncharacterized protein J4E88_004110 [Alternaria novae-zelandiae]KAI4684669.1 hypothetical protein J4E88_004110 [Alternaria novae-zelandiae]